MSKEKDDKQDTGEPKKKRAAEMTNREAIEKLFPKKVIKQVKEEVSK